MEHSLTNHTSRLIQKLYNSCQKKWGPLNKIAKPNLKKEKRE